MKAFAIHPLIVEFPTFKEFAEHFTLSEKDLILTNKFIYDPFIKPTGVPCPAIFQEQYGAGEPTDTMIDAIRADMPEGIERLIAVGGGTVIDIAKVLILECDGNTEDMFMKRCEVRKTKHLLTIPTTCGTGSEVTNVAITGLENLKTKLGLALDIMYADTAVLIPEMIATLPYKFFATSSVDALIHCVESYLSPKATDYSQIFSVQGIDSIIRHYQMVVAEGVENWAKYSAAFLRASNYGGIAFGNAGCAAIHALSYPLSGKYHIPHGEANLLMFKSVIYKYIEKQPKGAINGLEEVVAKAMGRDTTDGIWDALFALLDDILKRKPLMDYGIQKDELEGFCDGVIEGQQRLLANNYVFLEKQDMLDIYLDCFDK